LWEGTYPLSPGVRVDAILLNVLACNNFALKFGSGILTICALVIVEKAIIIKRVIIFIDVRLIMIGFACL
jgi:hypothetical protein